MVMVRTVLVVVEPLVLRDSELKDLRCLVLELLDLLGEVGVRDYVVQTLLDVEGVVKVRARHAWALAVGGGARDAGLLVGGADVLAGLAAAAARLRGHGALAARTARELAETGLAGGGRAGRTGWARRGGRAGVALAAGDLRAHRTPRSASCVSHLRTGERCAAAIRSVSALVLCRV
eukprot:COSAG06_NODE_6589_length_2865_cov_2.101229_2_plen_177_part_00